MRAGAEQFGADNPYGVFAFTPGLRHRRGRRQKEVTLLVYVERKSTAPTNPIPPLTVSIGKRVVQVMPDIIATGQRARTNTRSGGADAFEGLFAGSSILAEGSVSRFGGVGAILGEQGEPTHVVTAGHLFPRGEVGASVSCAKGSNTAAESIGRLVVNFLDSGSHDAAVVELNAAGVALAHWTRDRHRGPRLQDFVTLDDSTGLNVQAYLPVPNDYSAVARTRDHLVTAHVLDDVRGRYTLTGVIGTDPTVRDQEGDSGTVLFTDSRNPVAVGTCVGQFSAMSIFESVGKTIAATRRTLQRRALTVWS